MLEYGDYDITACPSVRLAGPSEGPMPEQIYGMLSALLLRSGDMGDAVASAMAVSRAMYWPMPLMPFHWSSARVLVDRKLPPSSSPPW